MMVPAIAESSFKTWSGRIVRRLRRRYNDQCTTILAYHSIAPTDTIFTAGTNLRHHPRDFERHIDYLAERYNIFSLRELVDALERGAQLRRAVVLTFDDGFADVHLHAMPILFRRRIPMTVFPVTSVVGNRDLMWQHKLAWLVRSGHDRRVRDALCAEGWNIGPNDDHIETYARLHFRPQLPAVLEDVLQSAGTTGRALAEKHRPYLDHEDLAAADPEFVEFGNHTDTHPILSALTMQLQMVEIAAAQRKIMEWTGRPPLAFAFPFGLKAHYDEDSRHLARRTGHRAALDMRRRLNLARVDPFDLSRKPVPAGSQGEFERTVEDWPANAPPGLGRGVR